MDRVCIEGFIPGTVKSSCDQYISHADSCMPFEARLAIEAVRVTPRRLSSKMRLTTFAKRSLAGDSIASDIYNYHSADGWDVLGSR
jgi:hypothetical protein